MRVRCNWCEAEFEEDEILHGEYMGGEYCPKCHMDLIDTNSGE